MKKSFTIKKLLLLTAIIFFTVNANAQFSGYYDPANWTTTITPVASSGSVNAAGAPASITIISGNAGVAGNIAYSITIPSAGNVTFDWSYTTADGAQYDYPQYAINGVVTLMPGYNIGGGTNPQSGTANIAVAAGDVFALRMLTTDGGFGPGTTVFSNFAAPPSFACSGPAVAGTASGPASVCPGASVPLILTGNSSGTGTIFQWEQFNTTTLTWDPILGANGANYTVSGFAASADYRCVVTCTSSSSTDISNTVSVILNPPSQCYCTSGLYAASTYGCTDGDYVNSFSTTGGITDITNNNTGCGSAPALTGYSDYTTMFHTGIQGSIVNFSFTNGNWGEGYKIWVDWNQNGNFADPGEEMYASAAIIPNLTTVTGSFVIPITAPVGVTRMRIRCVYNTTIFTSCSSQAYGEAEDYSFEVQATVGCSGVPTAGTAGGPASICPNTTAALTLTGYTIAAGITIQWEQFNTTTLLWAPIPGANNPSYTTPPLTAAADYRVVVTCINTSQTDISNTVSVSMSPFYSCYCTSNALNAFDGEITNTTVGSLNNSSTCASSNQLYTDYTITIPPVPLLQTLSIPVSVTAGSCGGSFPAEVKIWIDYNQDGQFTGIGEEVFSGVPPGGNYTPAGVPVTGSFIVPPTALTGITRMRVILNQPNWGPTVVCGGYQYGETEDYLVDILPASSCSGTPTAGIASGPSGICPGANVTLSLTGYTAALGINIQWEQFNTLTLLWDPIPGATTPTYSVAGQSAATDYRAVVTCTNTLATDISNTVNVPMNPFYSCYCTSAATQAADGEILNVTFGAMNNSSTCAASNQLYTDFTGTVTPPQVVQGNVVPFSVHAGTCGGNYPGGLKIYIDYNQNGIFDPTSEQAYFQGGFTYGPTMIINNNISIPLSALPGITRMRVIMMEGGTATSIVPCGTYGYGETEDYLVEIVAAVACGGQPVAGTASGPVGVCPNATATLNLTGYTLGTGITIQWEVFDPINLSWGPAPGVANNPGYTTSPLTAPADFRAVVTCVNSSLTDISNTVSIGMNNWMNCYCVPTYANPFAGDIIANVQLGTLSNNTVAAGNPAPCYVDYTLQQPPLAIPDLLEGQTTNLTLTFGTDGTQYHRVWIDMNHDGMFSATETFTGTPNPAGGSGTAVVPLAIPIGALSGITRMRIRGGDDAAVGTGQACGASNSTYGEGEDYFINIIALAPCSAMPSAGMASGPSSALCAGANPTANLSITGYTAGTGIALQWEYYNVALASWLPVTNGGTSASYTTVPLTATTDYRCVVTCTPVSLSATSNTVTVTIDNPTAIPYPGSRCDAGTVTLAATPIPSTATLKWYDVATGGTSLGTGSIYTTPSLTGNATYYVEASTGAAPTPVTMPAQGTTFAGNVRGYSFTAPVDFTITGVQAMGTTVGNQSIAIVKFVPATPPPIFAASTNAFVTLFLTQNNPATGVIPVNIPVAAGDVIGVLGQLSNVTSYATPVGPYTTTIAGQSCVLTRMIMQFPLTTTAPQNLSTEVGAAIGRVQLTYQTGCAGTRVPVPATISGTSSGTGLSSGGTTIVKNQANGTTENYFDACNDKVATVVDAPGGNVLGSTFAIALTTPTLLTYNGAPYVKRMYDITPASNGPATVTLFALQSEFNEYNAYVTANSLPLPLLPASPTDPNVANIVLTQYHGLYSAGTTGPLNSYNAANDEFIPAGSITKTWNPAGYWEITFPVTGFSGFVIHTGNGPLIIGLRDIKATNIGKRNRVDWNTATESAGDYFIVERSADGRNFTAIGTVNAKGQASAYSYWDENPFNGINYYRLKLMDAASHSSYSKVVNATVKDANAFSMDAYPNPVSDNLTIKVYGAQGNNAVVTISDATGKIVRMVEMNSAATTISMNGLASGMYLVKYSDNIHMQSVKVNKQ